jgi:hypothetical protein
MRNGPFGPPGRRKGPKDWFRGRRERAYADVSMANHLTPEQIAVEHEIEREEVLRFCVDHDVPVFHGQIDRTLFAAEWTAAHGSHDGADRAE